MRTLTSPQRAIDDSWLRDFHAGDRAVVEEIYRAHFETVQLAIGSMLDGANRDTVVHELFLRLLTNETMRKGFVGGSIAGWLRTIGRNMAIDFHRRLKRETNDTMRDEPAPSRMAERIEARLLVERFRRDVLPAKWAPVFEARFIRELNQREAARAVGLSRTTLAYQEMRIRMLLRHFLLHEEDAP